MKPYIAAHGGALGAGRPARRMASRARRAARAAGSSRPQAFRPGPSSRRRPARRVPGGRVALGRPARVRGRAAGRAARVRGRAATAAPTRAHLHRRVDDAARGALHRRPRPGRDHLVGRGSRRGLSPGGRGHAATRSGCARVRAGPAGRTRLVTSVGSGAGGRAVSLHVRTRPRRHVVDRRRPALARHRARRRSCTPVRVVANPSHGLIGDT